MIRHFLNFLVFRLVTQFAPGGRSSESALSRVSLNAFPLFDLRNRSCG